MCLFMPIKKDLKCWTDPTTDLTQGLSRVFLTPVYFSNCSSSIKQLNVVQVFSH